MSTTFGWGRAEVRGPKLFPDLFGGGRNPQIWATIFCHPIARNQTGSKATKTRTVAVLKDDNNTVSGFTGYATMEGLRFGFFKASQFIL